MSAWIIRSAELRRLRVERLLDQTELARISGVSVRAIRALEASNKGVTLTTLDCLTKALDSKRAEIATHAEPKAKATAQTKAPAPTVDTKPTATRAPAERVRMIDLREKERTMPPPEALEIDGEWIPKLTVLKYRQCFTAYLAREGERYWISGTIVDDRGLPPAEAKLIGARSGEAARFDVRCPVGEDGDTLGVTAFTATGALTVAMQDADDKIVRFIARVVALKDVAPGTGFTFFMRERPSPWALVVERVLDVADAPAPRAPKRAR